MADKQLTKALAELADAHDQMGVYLDLVQAGLTQFNPRAHIINQLDDALRNAKYIARNVVVIDSREVMA